MWEDDDDLWDSTPGDELDYLDPDYLDDAYALASAGYGTDEDYGLFDDVDY
jgi:hypothetical protein